MTKQQVFALGANDMRELVMAGKLREMERLRFLVPGQAQMVGFDGFATAAGVVDEATRAVHQTPAIWVRARMGPVAAEAMLPANVDVWSLVWLAQRQPSTTLRDLARTITAPDLS
jgi:hypothetical protein